MRRAALPMALALCSCAQNLAPPVLSILPTEIAVRPEDFLDGVVCSASPGAMQSYVLTVESFSSPTDTTPFALPSTAAAPCAAEAGLQTPIVVGQLYGAEIDGYEAPAAALTPYGGASSGSRDMLDANGKLVSPRWTTRCNATAPSAVTAIANQIGYLSGCEPIIDHGASATAVRIDLARMLGAAPCPIAADFTLDSLAGDFPPLFALGCSSPPLDRPATPGVRYLLYLHATRTGDIAVGAECFAEAAPGEIVQLACDPLQSQGGVTLSLSGVTRNGSPVCPPPDVFRVAEGAPLLDLPPIACNDSAQIGPLAPGVALFSALVYAPGGQPIAGVSCAAQVQPGRTVAAACL